ncbi:sodium:solute symporter family transporter, partial [Rhodothermus marinus]|uniref:sodium:solute symporter family transporter n=1 Tax=Rhodothermus marinus TaxID=29549 RepID=UPI0024343FE1
MHLTWLDGVLIAAYFVFSLGIALYYYRRAGKDTSEFFLSGRSMPWWLAGTSMVATTFAADTPLAVSELVAYNGIAGNWLWWNFALGGVLTVFFFARLWRRSGVLTDVEFVELRYSGPAAAWLRGIKAVYFGLLMNVIIIGWVSLAMETVIDVLFPGLTLFGRASFTLLGIEMSASLVLVGLLVLLVGVYSLISGLWGVAVTDLFQFVLAMVGTTLLAIFALDLPEVGGLAGLKARLPETTFRMLPTIGEAAQGAG